MNPSKEVLIALYSELAELDAELFDDEVKLYGREVAAIRDAARRAERERIAAVLFGSGDAEA